MRHAPRAHEAASDHTRNTATQTDTISAIPPASMQKRMGTSPAAWALSPQRPTELSSTTRPPRRRTTHDARQPQRTIQVCPQVQLTSASVSASQTLATLKGQPSTRTHSRPPPPGPAHALLEPVWDERSGRLFAGTTRTQPCSAAAASARGEGSTAQPSGHARRPRAPLAVRPAT